MVFIWAIIIIPCPAAIDPCIASAFRAIPDNAVAAVFSDVEKYEAKDIIRNFQEIGLIYQIIKEIYCVMLQCQLSG